MRRSDADPTCDRAPRCGRGLPAHQARRRLRQAASPRSPTRASSTAPAARRSSRRRFSSAAGRSLQSARHLPSRSRCGRQRVDMSGKTIVPGFVNVHGHVQKGSENNLSVRDDLIRRLRLYASYGVTTVVSLDQTPADETRNPQAAGRTEHDGAGPHADLHNRRERAPFARRRRRRAAPWTALPI